MPRSPGGRQDAGRIVGGRTDWSGGPRQRATRQAARNTFFGIGIVGSFGSYRQPQFFPLLANDALGSTTVLDSFTDASAPRDLTAYNAAWSAPVFTAEPSPKTTGGGITSVAGTSSAYYPSVSQADVRVFATVTTKPADGNWFELLARVQNPGAGQNCYALVGFANAGTDSIELYQFTAGAGAFLGVFQAADYSAGDTFALDISGVSPLTVVTAYKNGVQIGTVSNLSFVNGAGSVGVRLADNVGVLDDFGIGSGTSDVATRVVVEPRAGADTLGTSDVATRALISVTRVAADALGTADVAVGARTVSRTAADTLGTTDAAVRLVALRPTASDTLGTSDVAIRAPLVQVRVAADSLGTADAATMSLRRVRTAADALGTYPGAVLSDLPQLYWRLGEPSGSVAVDASGNGRSGTYHNNTLAQPGLVANDPNTSVQFTKTSSAYLTAVGYQPFVNGGRITIEGITSRGIVDTNAALMSSQGANFARLLLNSVEPATISWDPNGSVGGGSFGIGNAWPAAAGPMHWAVTFDEPADTAQIYLNGVLVGSSNVVSKQYGATPGDFGIGGAPSPGGFFDGIFDEIAVYNYVLSATRIAARRTAMLLGGAGTTDAATASRTLPRTAADTLGTTDAATRAPLTRTRTASDALGASTYDPAIDVDSPVSHWKLGGTTTAVDRKGTRNLPAFNGPIVSAPTLVANNGSDTSNRFVRASGQLFGSAISNGSGNGAAYNTAAWSVEAWLTLASNPGTTHSVLGRDDHQTIRLAAGTGIQLRWRDAADIGRAIGSITAVVGTTYHVVGVFDGTDAILYVNGVENARLATTSRSVPDATPIVGSQNYGPGSAFDGTIDEVAWYSGALSAARVLAHYQAGSVPAPIDVATRVVTLPRTANDSLGTSDAATGVLTVGVASRTGSDSLATTDAAVRAPFVAARTGTDALATTDAATRAAFLFRVLSSDVLGTTDAATRAPYVRGRSATDVLATTDVATKITLLARTAADVLATSDTATRAGLVRGRSGVDSLATTDVATQAGLRSRTASDTLATSDTAARAALVRVRVAADALATTDAAVQVRLLPRVAADSLGTTDVATRAPYLRARSAADALATTDVAVQGVRGRTATDALGTTDVAAPRVVLRVTATDTLATTDVATRTALRARVGADLLATTDAATRAVLLRVRAAADALATTDAAVRAPLARGRTTADSLATTDQATRVVTRPRTGTDALATTDVATRGAAVRSRAGADSLATSDAATKSGAAVAVATDTLATTDLAARVVSRSRTANDALGTSDVALRAPLLTRIASDLLGTADLATRVLAQSRLAVDVLATSDVASRALLALPTAADLLGTDDAAELRLAYARAALDTLGTYDEALGAGFSLKPFGVDLLGTTDQATMRFIPLLEVVHGRTSAHPAIAGVTAALLRLDGEAASQALVGGVSEELPLVGGSSSARSMVSGK